jgi:osmoprotectant transport system permease protein
MSAWSELADYLTTADNWWGRRGIATRLGDHVRLSAASVAAAAAVAIPPALWLGHIRRGGVLATAVVNIGRAVPSLAIISLALPLSLRYGFGLGFWPTFVALVALGLPPIFTNTYAGVVGVPPPVVDAARGMGMRGGEVLWRVEAPTALPLLLTGLRVSAVQVVATATLGAFVGFGGLGAFINEGFRQQDDAKLLTGAVLVAALAVVTELGFGMVQRRLTPWITDRNDRKVGT